MTIVDLARQVSHTRNLQKQYFRGARTKPDQRPPGLSDILSECRKSERLLDQLVEEILRGQTFLEINEEGEI